MHRVTDSRGVHDAARLRHAHRCDILSLQASKAEKKKLVLAAHVRNIARFLESFRAAEHGNPIYLRLITFNPSVSSHRPTYDRRSSLP